MTAGVCHLAYVGLGSNLDGPVQQVRRALRELAALPQTRLVAQSPLYWSDPLGPPGQPDYVNAVAQLETTLDAHLLLDHLQAIEAAHGRERATRWGARTLDLDLLLFDDARIATERLCVPHAHMIDRAFVLVPLHDIAPDLQLDGGRSVSDLVGHLGEHGLRPVESGS